MKHYHADIHPGSQSEPKSLGVGLVSFLILLLCVLIFLAGFMLGYEAASEKPQAPTDRSIGYTVIDADHVVNQDGDTVKYNWNKVTK